SEETEELVKQEKAVPNRSKVTNTPSKSVWEKRTKK
ncbi:MAG: hypothetical protein ACI85N_000933, partial [Gammaproteobacteria bacterium]